MERACRSQSRLDTLDEPDPGLLLVTQNPKEPVSKASLDLSELLLKRGDGDDERTDGAGVWQGRRQSSGQRLLLRFDLPLNRAGRVGSRPLEIAQGRHLSIAQPENFLENQFWRRTSRGLGHLRGHRRGNREHQPKNESGLLHGNSPSFRGQAEFAGHCGIS
jgi:hypothetical protein